MALHQRRAAIRRPAIILAVCIFFGLILVSTLSAQKLPELKCEKFVLSNGLQVLLHEDHTVPMVTTNIWYHVGSGNEKKGKTGFAHVFEHMMFQASEHVPYGMFAEKVQGAGGEYNGSTNQDRTNYYINIPSNYLELALWLESDRMASLLPAVTQERLDNQKDVVKNERRERNENQPYGRVDEISRALMYPSDHPYSWPVIGSMADLSAASFEDIKDFFRQYYTPNNASLCIAGDFDPAVAKQLVEKYFANIPSGPNIDRLQNWIPELNGIRQIVVEDNVRLPRIHMYWHSPAIYMPGDAELDLFANALGNGKTSRLYKSLIYEKQIAQDVFAYQYSQEIASTFTIVATARPGHSLAELQQVIDSELEKILTTGITPEELKIAQTAYEVGYVQSLAPLSGFGGRADRFNGYNLQLGDPNKFQWDLDRYTKATPASVMQEVRKYIDLNRRGILEIVPRGERKGKEINLDRTVEPKTAEEPTFNPPPVQRAKLSNGAELRLVEDHRLPLIQIGLVLLSGWSADPPGGLGTASITAEMLDEGTKSKTTLQIADEIDKLGISLNTSSGYDAASIFLGGLKRNLDPALDLMADIVINPSFPKEELERIRASRLSRIMQEKTQPAPLAMRAFNKVLYGDGHPYAQPPTGSGTEASVKALGQTDLVNFYKGHYLPNNATFVMAGDITLAEAQAKLEKAFKNWKAGTVTPTQVSVPKPPQKTVIYLVDKPGAAQSQIAVGHLGLAPESPDRFACLLLSNALGGGSNGRLYKNLRQDKGYTYGAYCNFAWRRHIGPFVGQTPVQTSVTKEAVSEFVKEYTEIGSSRPISAEELAWNKDNLVKQFPESYETVYGITNALYQDVVQNLPEDYAKTFRNNIRKVSIDEIQAATQKYIHSNALIIIVVGDVAKIEAGLKELNLGDVVILDPSTL